MYIYFSLYFYNAHIIPLIGLYFCFPNTPCPSHNICAITDLLGQI